MIIYPFIIYYIKKSPVRSRGLQIKWAIISNLVMDQTHWIMFERKGNCNLAPTSFVIAPTNVRKDYLILSLPLHLILTPSNPSPLHLGRKPPSPQTDPSSHHYLIVQPLLVIKFEHNTATTVAHTVPNSKFASV